MMIDRLLSLSLPQQYPVDLDKRSLAVFRILLGLFLFMDTVWGRCSLQQYDLAWYTSEPIQVSYLYQNDTPHQSILHQVWFYRGTALFQYSLFLGTAIVCILFAVGYHCHAILKGILFLLITAQQNRNMYLHDGSDTLVRHLLFWSCFLPVSEYYSWDAAQLQTIAADTTTTSTTATSCSPSDKEQPRCQTISTLAAGAILVQIVLMYWGTVLARTMDHYTWDEVRLGKVEWLPPNASAVHYAISGSFATRQHFLNHWIRTNSKLSRCMTTIAMIVESIIPLIAVLGPTSKRHWCALIMILLHVGLWISLRLPQWQALAVLIQFIWIPTHIWDQFLPLFCGNKVLPRKEITNPIEKYKKTDGDIVANNASELLTFPQPTTTSKNIRTVFSQALQVFWFGYMLFNFAGERKWIPKYDRGDIGEAFRLSQYWVMFATVSHTAHTTLLTGLVPSNEESQNNTLTRIDLFHFIRYGHDQPADPIEFVPQDMSRRYPSARWERAMSTWASQYSNLDREKQFSRALCVLVNRDRSQQGMDILSGIELRFQHLRILPPGAVRRYANNRAMPDTLVRVTCEPQPSPWTPKATMTIPLTT